MNQNRFNPTWDLEALCANPAQAEKQIDEYIIRAEKLNAEIRALSHDSVEEAAVSDTVFCETLNTSGTEEGLELLSRQAYLMDKASEIEKILIDFDTLSLEADTCLSYLELASAKGFSGAEFLSAKAKADRLKSLKADASSRIMNLLKSVADADSFMEKAPLLEGYRFFMEENLRLAKHKPDPDKAGVMRAMQENGGSAWYALWAKLNSNAKVTLKTAEGEKTVPLSEARGYAGSPDAALRKAAYEAELASYETYLEPMAACMNGIKGEAVKELEFKNYESIKAEMLDINKLSEETLDSLLETIRESLPVFRKYLKLKASYLGYDGKMPWYELLAPVGKQTASISYDQAHDLITDAFKGFSEELSEFAHNAFVNRWLDALPQEGKSSGGICYDLPGLSESRILTNFTGSHKDTRTLAHELGHAYHGRQLAGVPVILRDPPTPICETASLMNEIIFQEQMLEKAEGDELLYIIDQDLIEAVQTLMDIYSRYIFEDRVFEIRKNRTLSAEELCELMKEAQLEVFGDALDPRFLHPYMWMCKVHYYIPEFHYYNYPYFFGMLLANGLYSEYLKDRTGFPEKYKALLAWTCSGSAEEISAQAGLDINKKEFWQGSISGFARKTEIFARLIAEKTSDR